MEETTKKKDRIETKKQNKFIQFLKKHKKKFIMLVLLCIMIYIIYLVVNLFRNPTDTVYIERGQIQEEETGIGYIVRDETVLKGENYKNGIEQIKTEGEKVAKGEAVFRYYSNNEESLVEKIQELDTKIDEAMANQESVVTSDTKVLEEQIDSKISELYGESDLTKIQDNKQTITNSMTRKAQIAGELSPAGSYLQKLIDQRKKYENQLNSGTEDISASRSGVVSYRVDGYEDVLSTDDFSKYTKDFLNNLNLRTGQIVPTSNESGKIINNYYCYIVSVLESDQAKEAEVGDEVGLRLPSGTVVDATIEYKTIEGNDSIITFKIEKAVEELISYRKVSFGVIWWSASGMKVPNQALSTEEKDGNQISYVTRKRIGYEDKIIVKVLNSNEKYSIVTNYTSEELGELGYTSAEIRSMPSISIYDEILLN